MSTVNSTDAPGTRKLSGIERWHFARQNLQCYVAVSVGVTYLFPPVLQSVSNEDIGAIYKLVILKMLESQKHPLLACSIEGGETLEPRWKTIEELDVDKIVLLHQLKDEEEDSYEKATEFEKLLSNIHQQPIDADEKDLPHWRLHLIFPSGKPKKVMVVFAYSHTLGDGISGTVFHYTLHQFLESITADSHPINSESKNSFIAQISPVSLPFPIEELTDVSCPPFTIATLILTEILLPTSASIFLGLTTPFYRGDPTITSSRPFAENFAVTKTQQRTLLVPPAQWTAFKALTKQVRFSPTTLITAVQGYCMWKVLPQSKAVAISTATPVNLRKYAGAPEDTIGNLAGSFNFSFLPSLITTNNIDFDFSNGQLFATLVDEAISNPIAPLAKAYAAKLTQKTVLSESAKRIGLVKLVGHAIVPQQTTNFKHNTKLDVRVRDTVSNAKGGGVAANVRGGSTELSNLGLYTPPDTALWKIEDALFAGSASPSAAPLELNAVVTAQGGLGLCWTYEEGAVEESQVMEVRRVFREAFEGLL